MTYVVKKLVLLENASATGLPGLIGEGGRYVFSIVGTFGGAAQLQMRGPDNVTWIDLANGSFAANGAVAVDAPLNKEFRVTLAGGSSGMYAAMERVEIG